MATGADTPLLLCYDGSEPARHAIARAADLLRTRNAVVLTVWQPTGSIGRRRSSASGSSTRACVSPRMRACAPNPSP